VLAAAPLRLRGADPADGEVVWAWRRAGGAARFYRSGADPSLAEHLAWWDGALADPRRRLLMACDGPDPVAHLRLDRAPDGAETVGIVLAPARRGAGLSAATLEAALDDAARRGVARVLAEVHGENAASLRLFEGAGFAALGADGPFRRYALALAPGRAENPGAND
jgi:RimJ/RimL family protein N-acetyltransferase